MQGNKITPHETFQVHEILMHKSLCANKAAMYAPMVQCAELKGIITSDLNQSKQHITELKGFITNSELSDWQGANYTNVGRMNA